MSASDIAKVVADFRLGRVATPTQEQELTDATAASMADGPVIDITPVYTHWVNGDRPWAIYEDTLARPPFEAATWAYENEHGNVVIMHTVATDITVPDTVWSEKTRWQPIDQDHIIDWDAIRWVTSVSFWVGGFSRPKNEHIPTTGPMYQLIMAVYNDGSLGDIRWLNVFEDIPREHWDGSATTLFQAMTVLNCRNVEVMEPVNRPRSERKRVARHGVTITEIHITPVGKYRRATGPKRFGEGIPLGVVRGHVARYGPQYGRGKLFGKYEGEFWISAHMRGTAELGEAQHEYTVEN